MNLDRGSQFVVGLMKKLNKILRIEKKKSTAFYPQMTDREDKPEAGTVLKDVHQSQAKQLVGIVGNYRVCL